MKSNLTLFIIGAIVALGVIGGVAYVAVRHQTSTPESAVTVAVGTSTAPTQTITKPGYTVELQSTSPSFKSIEPTLTAGLTFDATVPTDARAILQKQYDTLVAKLKTDPTNAGDWLNLAIVYHTADDFVPAADIWVFLTKVIAPPANAVAYDNLGKLYKFDLKDFPKSEQYFKKSMQADPTSITPYIELAGLYGDLYKANTTAAPDILAAAAKQFPTNPDPLILLGEYYRDHGDSVKARDFFTKAVALLKASHDDTRAAAVQTEIDRLPQ